MTPKMRSMVRSALRKIWLYGEPRREALKGAKAYKKFWFCALCTFPTDKPEVDHVDPVGPTPGSRRADGVTWDGFMSRLFVPASGLQILCRECHAKKTLAKLDK